MCLLHQRTQRAAADHEQVVEGAARDALLLPDLAADLQRRDDVGDGDDVGDTARQARLPDCLSVLAERVTRHEVGDDA